jgi:hypothetical protein
MRRVGRPGFGAETIFQQSLSIAIIAALLLQPQRACQDKIVRLMPPQSPSKKDAAALRWEEIVVAS